MATFLEFPALESDVIEIALGTMTAVRDRADKVEAALSQRALDAGMTWGEIGRRLGKDPNEAFRTWLDFKPVKSI